MDCPKGVNMDWGKGTEIYLFCTGKERIQELRKRVTSWCGRRVVRLNIILKSFLKSFMQLKLHGAGVWRTMILFRSRKRSSFRMAEFLYAKSLIWLSFILLASGKNPMKGVTLICFETLSDKLWPSSDFWLKMNPDLKIKVNFSFCKILNVLALVKRM